MATRTTLTQTVPTDRHRSELRALARLTLFATALGIALLGLLAADRALPSPPGLDPGTWPGWVARVGPAPVLMSGVRLAGIVAAGYLLLVVTVELVGRATGLRPLIALSRAISAPMVRGLVRSVAGVGMAASITALAAVAPVSAGASPSSGAPTTSTSTTVTAPTRDPGADPPVMRALDPSTPEPTDAPLHASDAAPPEVTATTTSVAPLDDAAPTMRLLDDPPSSTAGPPTSSTAPPSTNAPPTDTATTGPPTTVGSGPATPPSEPGATGATDPSAGPSGDPAPGGDRWVIQHGDHLWGVARRTLSGAWHRPPTDGEVARYLDQLIDANADVLVVADDADLVFVGQQFTLPPIPAR